MTDSPPATADDLLEIARRARSLEELIAAGAASAYDTEPASQEARTLVERWAFAFCRGDLERFSLRLSWEGLSPDEVTGALAKALPSPPPRLPEWIAPLAEVLAGPHAGDPEAEPEARLPFVGLWPPYVQWARRRLERLVPGIEAVLAAGARRDLEHRLIARLVRVSELTLYERFAAVRDAVRRHDGARPEDGRADGDPIYRAFLESLADGGMAGFLREYSALARQICRLLDGWVSATSALALRLAADRERIATRFGGGVDPGRVVRIDAGPADRHRGGQQVLGLTFSSGLELYYKPRDVGLEAALARFLEWLEAAGLEPALPALQVLEGEGYGWTERVRQCPASDRRAATDHYRRAGALLCACRVLGAVDLHMDNLVAGSSGPVVVDAETLLQPAVAVADGEDSGADHGPPPPDSLLACGLVSFLEVDPRGRIFDSGGLCGSGHQLEEEARRGWSHPNTDAMEPSFAPAWADPQANLLLVDGVVQPPEWYLPELADGFAAAHEVLRRSRDQLLAPGGPLSWFSGRPSRILFRPSNLYATVLSHLMTPRYQRSGFTQGILIDTMNRVFRDHHRRPRVWPLVVEERRSLLDLDIPWFAAPTDRCEFDPGGGIEVEGYLETSGLECARRRLEALDDGDLERQLEVLRAALWTPPGESGKVQPRDPASRAAGWIAHRLVAMAGTDASGAPTWSDGERDSVARWFLYDGDLGVALLFAALARTTGSDDHRETALRTCRAAESLVGELDRPGEPVPIGACNGIGGIIYALTCAGQLLAEPSLVELALQVAGAVTEQRIASDRRFDVEGGAAGAALALLALHQATGDVACLDRAAACGQHLLEHAAPAPGGGVGWSDLDGLMLAGFAHGAAGIACALARLAGVTGRDDLRDLARSGFRYERALFDADTGNWPVLVAGRRQGEVERIVMNGWCHGAPGAALSRIGALDALADEQLHVEINIALDTVLRVGVGDVDHLCCGTMGRVDALLTAGRKFKNFGHTRAAGIRAVMVLQRAFGRGSFSLSPLGTDGNPRTPGLFRGESGIGYQLLRLAFPDRLPSLLMFEPTAGDDHHGEDRSS